jgi:hypothetical protein
VSDNSSEKSNDKVKAESESGSKSKAAAKADAPKKTAQKDEYVLPASWQNAWKIAAGVGVVGIGITAAMMFGADGARASYSYLFGFYVFLTIALGSLFFVLIQHLTSAGWSVTVRRTAEFFASALPVFAILFLPILLKADLIYPWTQPAGSHEGAGEHGAKHEEKKEGALGLPFVNEAHAQAHAAPAAPSAASAAPSAVPSAAAAHEDGSGKGQGNGKGQGQGNGTGADIEGRKAHEGGAKAHEGGAKAHGGDHEDGTGSGAGDGHGKGKGNGSGAHHEGKAHEGGAEHHGDALEHEHAEILEAKQKGWLGKNFWYVRAAGYFAVWTILAWFFFGNSTKQDKSKDPKLTLSSAKWAPLCAFAFGLSLTFAAVDWLMSLDPMWFSTIYGVYIFATSVVSSLAMIIVVTMALRNGGPLSKVVTTEHYHDLGKLMFGFNVFWAYIGFSQMMLIWYAALPSETPFYHKRWETPSSVVCGNHSGDFWTNVSVALIVGHFVVAFLFLISRNVKRRLPMLRAGAFWMLAMHVLDMYWFVLPNFEPNTKAAGFSFALTDVTAPIGVGGIYLAVVFYMMTKHALIPTGDPRLARSIAFQNA